MTARAAWGRECSPRPAANVVAMPGDFDLVKERVDIVQLISESVPLKKAGRIYVGLCPFHLEKTPSFHVDAERRTYKCFGCGEVGEVFNWLEKQRGLSPSEALKELAERAGVELTRRAPEERKFEDRLIQANDAAAFYFRQALRGTTRGKTVAEYLAKRGITPESIDAFGIGYAPDERSSLLAYLRKKGFSEDEGVAAGLIFKNENGLWDRFRDRLMVPIRDRRGRAGDRRLRRRRRRAAIRRVARPGAPERAQSLRFGCGRREPRHPHRPCALRDRASRRSGPRRRRPKGARGLPPTVGRRQAPARVPDRPPPRDLAPRPVRGQAALSSADRGAHRRGARPGPA